MILFTGFKGKNNSSYKIVSQSNGEKLYLTNSFQGLQKDIESLKSSYDRVYIFGLDRSLMNTVRIENCAEKDNQVLYTAFHCSDIGLRLRSQGIHYTISDKPTHYLCNEAYFYMLGKYNCNVIFIHIPSIKYMTDEYANKIITAIINYEEDMKPNYLVQSIIEQTRRALWEVKNVMDCVPDESWNKAYCQMPCWKHIYHMLHSLDLWFINPRDKSFKEPDIHEKDLNNLDIISGIHLSRDELNQYFTDIEMKITAYLSGLTDNQLLEYPPNCEYSKFTLILAQFRHLHSHMGMIMGFVIEDTGMWPRVLGLEKPFPVGEYSKFF